MERIPAWLICSGVTKSGSPIPSEITSGIVLMISKNLRIPDGLTRRTRSDNTSCLRVSIDSYLKHEVLSERVRLVKPSGIRKFFDIINTMPDVISLGVGEPDFVTPEHIRQAGIRSIELGHTRYTSNYGILELREEIAAMLHRRYGLTYDPKTEILVTVGVSEGVDLT